MKDYGICPAFDYWEQHFDDIIAWYYNGYMHAGFDGWIDNVYIYMYRSMYTDAM